MSRITVEQAIDDIREGKIVILVDDEDRENEGDLTMAAREGHPGSDQFYGQIRTRTDLPVHGRRNV